MSSRSRAAGARALRHAGVTHFRQLVCNHGADATHPGRHRPGPRRPARARGGGPRPVQERARACLGRARALGPLRQRPLAAPGLRRRRARRGHRRVPLRTDLGGGMAFVDTSFWFARAIARDRRHAEAVALADRFRDAAVLTSNLVLGETWTLLAHRAGHRHAMRWLDSVREQRVPVERVEPEVEADAWAWLRE